MGARRGWMWPRDRAEMARWVRWPSIPAGLLMPAGSVQRAGVVLAAADHVDLGELSWGWSTGRLSAGSSSQRIPSERRLSPRYLPAGLIGCLGGLVGRSPRPGIGHLECDRLGGANETGSTSPRLRGLNQVWGE
jgi:hypothetical protein